MAPPGRLVVVSANLKKALPRYLQDLSSLARFAARVREVVAQAPDALLLQEVVRSSAQRTAAELTEALGCPYEVAVSPAETAVVGTSNGREVVRNTAILLNAQSMRLMRKGGYAATSYPARDSRPGTRPLVKEHAHCLAMEAAGGSMVALCSVHFVTNNKFLLPALGYRHKGRWADELAEFMQSTYSPGPVPPVVVLGGDFNNRRCRRLRETPQCTAFPFWRRLCHERGFVDAVFERHRARPESLAAQSRKGRHVTRRIDYLFVRGRVFDASHDVSYDARGRDPNFYSDHRLLWAVVGPS